ncbi:MAG: hypothetical protein V8S76_05645 [Lachnospiraceae bacterium]
MRVHNENACGELHGDFSQITKMCAMIGIYSLVTAVLICLGYNVLCSN